MNKLYQNKADCTGCHGCYNVCPTGAITMERDEEGFLYPKINQDTCVNCDRCLRVCPINQDTLAKKTDPNAFAAVCNCEEVRNSSSSGGVFPLLAAEILKRGGVVFGAVHTADFRSVEHSAAHTAGEMRKQKGSKYLQSRIGSTYKEVLALLKKGCTVLFTGTPCQVAGLYSFLGKEYENLYTQDLICHGAPSPLVWEKYVTEAAGRMGAAPRAVFFRSKDSGWRNFSLKMEFSQKDTYCKSLSEDPYLKGFMSDIFLRPSCYQCRYKTFARQADITLADFWGVENLHPDLDDNNGVSLVFTHSSKGEELLNAVQSELVMIATDGKRAAELNPAMLRSAKTPERRREFMSKISSCSYAQLYNAFFRPSPFLRMKKKLRRAIKKLLGR